MASLLTLAADLRAGKITATAATRLALAAADQQSGLNAFVLLHPESSLEAARLADGAPPEPAASLHGVPIAIKDNIDEAGTPCSAGCAAYQDRVPVRDALVVTRLRGAGAILLGRTNMHELADGVTSENEHYGPVHNPHRRGYHPGGSSGGSAAAVAADIVPAALGTDTGGSVRIPAALCGIVGFKPTTGLVPNDGVMPLSTTLDHVGVLARWVRDAAAVLDVIADSQAFLQSATANAVPRAAQGRPGRLGILTGFGLDPDPEVSRIFESTLERLSALGFTTTSLHLEALARGLPLLSAIYAPEAAAYHRDRLAAHPDGFSAPIRLDLQRGLTDKAAQKRVLALEERNELTAQIAEAQRKAGLDALICPTTPHPAKPFGSPGSHTYLTYTCPFNLTGQPAISLPMGEVGGLPVGLQLIAPRGNDAQLLALAAFIEEHLQTTTRRA